MGLGETSGLTSQLRSVHDAPFQADLPLKTAKLGLIFDLSSTANLSRRRPAKKVGRKVVGVAAIGRRVCLSAYIMWYVNLAVTHTRHSTSLTRKVLALPLGLQRRRRPARHRTQRVRILSDACLPAHNAGAASDTRTAQPGR